MTAPLSCSSSVLQSLSMDWSHAAAYMGDSLLGDTARHLEFAVLEAVKLVDALGVGIAVTEGGLASKIFKKGRELPFSGPKLTKLRVLATLGPSGMVNLSSRYTLWLRIAEAKVLRLIRSLTRAV